MAFTEEQENKIISQTLDIINEKFKNNQETTIVDDTIYHILNIITVMGSNNNPIKLLDVLAPNTKDAFKLIGANKFGKIINDHYKQVFTEYQNSRGLFKSFKFKKIAISILNTMYEKIEQENEKHDLISEYLIPYIMDNYKDNINLGENDESI